MLICSCHGWVGPGDIYIIYIYIGKDIDVPVWVYSVHGWVSLLHVVIYSLTNSILIRVYFKSRYIGLVVYTIGVVYICLPKSITINFCYYSTLRLLLQTLTVVILVSLQMVIAILSAQSTQVRYSTIVHLATHCRDRTEGPACPMESGVDIYRSVSVCYLQICSNVVIRWHLRITYNICINLHLNWKFN